MLGAHWYSASACFMKHYEIKSCFGGKRKRSIFSVLSGVLSILVSTVTLFLNVLVMKTEEAADKQWAFAARKSGRSSLVSCVLFWLSTNLVFCFSSMSMLRIHELLTLYTSSPASPRRLNTIVQPIWLSRAAKPMMLLRLRCLDVWKH